MQRRSLLVVAAVLALAPTAAPATEHLVDGIAAQVGSRVVLVSEVLQAAAPQEAMMRKAGAPDSAIAKLRADALESLIEAKLIESVVQKLELYAKDDEIDSTIRSIAEENGLTLEQLYASVVFHGMTKEEYRQEIKHDLERRKVITNFIGADVQVSEADIKSLYQQRYADTPDHEQHVHVRQILVSYGPQTKHDRQSACDLVTRTRERVLQGESFETLAKEVSEVAPSQGGDIGWLPTADLASWMGDALKGLSAGDVSKLVVLPIGCSILKLVERREVDRPTLAKATPMLRQELWNKALEKAYHKWIEEQRKHTYIERHGHFAAAASFSHTGLGGQPDSEPASSPALAPALP